MWEVDDDERPRPPPSLAARSLDALHRTPVTMIILDDNEDPFNPEKLLSDSRSVHRPATPTPSLPSYEFSQSQAQAVQCPPEELEAQSSQVEEQDQPQREKAKPGCWPTTHRKFRRALLYALVLYFVLTVAVGAPILVVVRSLFSICVFGAHPIAEASTSRLGALSVSSQKQRRQYQPNLRQCPNSSKVSRSRVQCLDRPHPDVGHVRLPCILLSAYTNLSSACLTTYP